MVFFSNRFNQSVKLLLKISQYRYNKLASHYLKIINLTNCSFIVSKQVSILYRINICSHKVSFTWTNKHMNTTHGLWTQLLKLVRLSLQIPRGALLDPLQSAIPFDLSYKNLKTENNKGLISHVNINHQHFQTYNYLNNYTHIFYNYSTKNILFN